MIYDEGSYTVCTFLWGDFGCLAKGDYLIFIADNLSGMCLDVMKILLLTVQQLLWLLFKLF